jgi:glucokinase
VTLEDFTQDKLALAGDIGGTKANLGVFALQRELPTRHVMESYSSKDAASLEELIERFLAQHPSRFTSACFGIAGPVRQGVIKTTNLPWVVSEENLKSLLGLEHVRLINDLVAVSYSIPVLAESEVYQLNKGKPDPEGTVGIVAPGTGLGVSLLTIVDGKVRPIASEAGHVDFAPRNDTEIELLRHLLTRMPRVSVERLASGPGLFTIYTWLRDYRNYTEPSWLTERLGLEDVSKVISEVGMKEEDPLCVEALDLYVSILGASAGDLALSGMTTGGLYLGGGISPKIMKKLADGTFMAAFTSKGRFSDLMTDIPVRVILNDQAALLGAAFHALVD